MRWINRWIGERNQKKVEEVSSNSLQAGGRWRSGAAGGGESETSGRLGFICEHLDSDSRTHAGQKTIFNFALHRRIYCSTLHLWGFSSPHVQQESKPARRPQPQWIPSGSSLATLLGRFTAVPSLGSRRYRGLQYPHIAEAEKRHKFKCLQRQTMSHGFLLRFHAL